MVVGTRRLTAKGNGEEEEAQPHSPPILPPPREKNPRTILSPRDRPNILNKRLLTLPGFKSAILQHVA